MSLFKTSPLGFTRALAAVGALAGGFAHAHPGDHGPDLWQAVVHLLSEPDHLAGLALVVLIAVCAVRRMRKASAARAQRP
jgi:hydrogenase/urease accessory protein HupE